MIHDRRIALYYRLGSLIFTLIGLLAVMNVFAGEFNPLPPRLLPRSRATSWP